MGVIAAQMGGLLTLLPGAGRPAESTAVVALLGRAANAELVDSAAVVTFLGRAAAAEAESEAAPGAA